MDEIIISMQNWNEIRFNSSTLISLFKNKSGFVLDLSLFPPEIPLHAYAAVKDNKLGFYVISEENDIESPEDELMHNCFWFPCSTIALELSNTQKLKESLFLENQISEEEALKRINFWKEEVEQWIMQAVNIPDGIYHCFFIPTQGMEPEMHNVYFTLNGDDDEKVADLVLQSISGSFYDTVCARPPFPPDVSNYYMHSLI